MSKNYYPALPLRDVVVYPHVIVPLFIGREKSIAAIDHCMESDQQLLLVPQRDPKQLEPEIDDLYTLATLGRIVQMAKLSDGTIKVLVEGLERVKIQNWRDNDIFLSANTLSLNEREDSASYEEFQRLTHVAIKQFERYLKERDKNADALIETLKQLESPARIVDTIAAHLELEVEQRIDILGLLDVKERAERLLVLLEQELEKTELEKNIRKRVKQQMERNQREYYLNEQMKAIQKELGDMDEALNETEQLEQDIIDAKMPEEAHRKSIAELNKLKQMSPMSSEANVIRNYLEWMIDFPWSKKRRAHYDLERAETVLERDHYGLKDVKERIVEYLAVQKRSKNNSKAPIICLVGPPGVGKTSLGKSIAEATGRDFDRISLGGVHDEAEIRGHRRTYIGALPGKLVQKLSKLGSNNPVILLDEIDKIGHDHRGDPASALLEVLDPAQNNTFNDHYLETDVDLSKVLFIATANTLNIPAPLLDRMEIIRLAGYTTQEKIQIAERYILPRQRKENFLNKKELILKDNLIETIIENYTREAGVRNLEREIGKLARKAVRKLHQKETNSVTITHDNLEDFLGIAKYQRNEEQFKNRIGSVNGLAWTSVGGELLQIETAVFSGKGKLQLTGQMGDVMKESVHAALSVVRSYLDKHDPTFKFNDHDLHMHMPEGATPKDGPSAGIGMATALLSAFTEIPVRGDIAMTGEITLHGHVLAIGGLKEKLLAAQRSKMKTVLIPKDNVKDLRDIDQEVLNALEIISVKSIEQVFEHALEPHALPLTERIGKHKTLKKPIETRNDKHH